MGEDMNVLHRIKSISSVFIAGVLTAGAIFVAQPQTASAATTTCPQDGNVAYTNIIYCGLSGGTNTSDLIASFKQYYDANSDAVGPGAAFPSNTHKGDLQTIYNSTMKAAGITDYQAFVNSMSTSNTFLATAHSDGTITLFSSDAEVGTNMQIASRWTEGTSAFTRIGTTDAYMRSASTYFAAGETTVPMLVHMNETTGKADFGVWIPCGNAITFKQYSPPTPPKPPTPPTPPTTPTTPTASLACSSLTANSQGGDTYTFTAKANPSSTTITGYTFNFGDGTSVDTLTTGTATAISGSHTYTPPTAANVTYTASVTVTGPLGTFTAPLCMTPVSFTATTTTPSTPVTTASAPVPTPQVTELANTGAGNVIGIFAIVTTVGALGYHFILRRKLRA